MFGQFLIDFWPRWIPLHGPAECATRLNNNSNNINTNEYYCYCSYSNSNSIAAIVIFAIILIAIIIIDTVSSLNVLNALELFNRVAHSAGLGL